MLERVGIIDVSVGNVGSLCRALADTGVEVRLVQERDDLKYVDGIVLPGVGAFEHGVRSLRDAGLWEGIQEAVLADSLPILGICLGMQLLGDRSEEGIERGLGLIAGNVKHISSLSRASQELTIPNMGWCHVDSSSDRGREFLDGFNGKQRFYFVHSYYFCAAQDSNVLLSVGGHPDLTAAVVDRHICGFQFHPEKSHRFGQQALNLWVRGVL